ncbi:uncharacterized protein LOC133679256 isoform X2 [Populus nigra]|uniref:uncharacterized protein LOC133679256 isoform X2 n=1 Tax=Populus nigra TaxID=3691 RepID=UPI002B27B96C|nr:uncharacterized protein LOC133679256 isoform X2 [Populus nigra]
MAEPIDNNNSNSNKEINNGIRRLLLFRKAHSGVHRRLDWRCNGKGYVSFRNYIRRPRNWDSLPSHQSTPGNSGRWLQSTSPLSHLFEVDSWTSSQNLRSISPSSTRRTSFSSTASDNDSLCCQGVEPAYSFVGMHCIFDQCKAADGTLTVCSVSEPPSVIKQLEGHSKDVTDFNFSSNNQYIASASMDKTVRVWELSKVICIRVIYGISSQLCIRFHLVNNDFLSVGNTNREITVFNFSTGRIINKLVLDDKVTALDHDHTGHLIFSGDAQGCVLDKHGPTHRCVVSVSSLRSSAESRYQVTTVWYRSFSLLAGGPVLLTCTQDGSFSFFSGSLKLAPRVHSIWASFCPLLSLEKGEYIVA